MAPCRTTPSLVPFSFFFFFRLLCPHPTTVCRCLPKPCDRCPKKGQGKTKEPPSNRPAVSGQRRARLRWRLAFRQQVVAPHSSPWRLKKKSSLRSLFRSLFFLISKGTRVFVLCIHDSGRSHYGRPFFSSFNSQGTPRAGGMPTNRGEQVSPVPKQTLRRGRPLPLCLCSLVLSETRAINRAARTSSATPPKKTIHERDNNTRRAKTRARIFFASQAPNRHPRGSYLCARRGGLARPRPWACRYAPPPSCCSCALPRNSTARAIWSRRRLPRSFVRHLVGPRQRRHGRLCVPATRQRPTADHRRHCRLSRRPQRL